MRRNRRLKAVHPGDVLRDELKERGISVNRLAREIRVALSRASMIANGKRAITAETALRLARYFGTSPELWMNLQTAYDLETTNRKVGKAIRREVNLVA